MNDIDLVRSRPQRRKAWDHNEMLRQKPKTKPRDRDHRGRGKNLAIEDWIPADIDHIYR